MVPHHGDLVLGVPGEVVDRDDAALLELADVLDVLLQVGEAPRHRPGIGRPDLRERHAAVHLEGTERGHENGAARGERAVPAVDIEELLRPELEGEPGLGDHGVGVRERHPGRRDGVGAVRDVGERTAVDERRHALGGLHQVGLEGVAQQRRHRPDDLEVRRLHRASVGAEADHDPSEALLEILDPVGEAEDRHHLARRRDVEAGLARHTLAMAAETDHDVPQRAVVHVDHPAPQDAPRVEAERVPVMKVIVHHRGQQVVGRRDGMDVAGEVEVDVVGRDNLGAAATRAAALHSEVGPERGLAQGNRGLDAEQAKSLSEAHRAGGLPLARGCGGDGRDQDQAALRRPAIQGPE